MHVHACACMGMWMPEVKLGCHSSGLLFEAAFLGLNPADSAGLDSQ